MNGKHSLDDLFARILRDAEATPPPAVWEGILRQRGWAHRTMEQLRRKWGYGLAALLLLGGGAYWAATVGADTPTSTITVAQAEHPSNNSTSTEATATTLIDPAPAGPAHSSATQPVTTDATQHAEAAAAAPAPRGEHPAEAASPAERPNTSTAHATTTILSTAKSEKNTTRTPAVHPENIPVPAPATTNAQAPRGEEAPAHANDASAATNAMATPEEVVIAPANNTRANSTKTDGQANASVITPMPPAERSFTRPTEQLMATRQSGIRPILDRGHGELMPASAPPTENYVLPRSDWWIAAQSGFYQENRNWKGNDTRLADALNGTETPHSPWSAGLMAGREYRSGWGFAVGAEFLGARYRFEHDDRIVHRTETVTNYVVTLNTQVIDSYMDTLVEVSEERNKVRAMNSYSVVRVPLEGSYHKVWRRWHYGLRAGVAAEFVTMRSGLTLSTAGAEGSEYSVDLSNADAEKRSNTLLTGSLGLDLGYTLNERFSLWATPVYMRGLFPLSGGDSVYALPDRLGVRFRLTYTLPHRR